MSDHRPSPSSSTPPHQHSTHPDTHSAQTNPPPSPHSNQQSPLHTPPRTPATPPCTPPASPKTHTHVIIHPKDFGFFLENHSDLIRHISSQSGATIIIDRSHPPPSGRLNISGLTSDVSHCKRLIDQRLHRLRAEKPDVMWIPVEKIGLIVGVRGSTIRSINARSGAYATVKNQHVQGDKKQLLIYGPRVASDRARTMISDVLNGHSYSEQDQHTKKISVPHYMAGAIIGRGGANVRKVNVHTGAYIRVEPSAVNKSENNVILTGTPSALEKAEAMIRDILRENDTQQHHFKVPVQQPSESRHELPPSERFSNDHPVFPPLQKEEEKIRLSVREIDIIVGREATSLEQIRNRSGAFIEFSLMDKEQGHDEQTVYITGTRTEIIIALLLVEERLGMPLGELSNLGNNLNMRTENTVSRFRERPASSEYNTTEGNRKERTRSENSYEPLPKANASKSCEVFNSPKHIHLRTSDTAGFGNLQPDESRSRKPGSRHDLSACPREPPEAGEIDADTERISDASADIELRSRKLTDRESRQAEDDRELPRKRSSEGGSIKKLWKSDRVGRKRRERGPFLLPMHSSGRSLPQSAPYVPLYPTSQPGSEPVGVFNPADPHGYPIYPGMHPLAPHYFLPQHAHSESLAVSSDESISDGDYAEARSSEKADPRNATNSSVSDGDGDEVGLAAGAGKDGIRRSTRSVPTRKRRKLHHPFVYGYPGADRGFLFPHSLGMYPGHHHPPLHEIDNKSAMRRPSKHTSEVDHGKQKPSKGTSHGTFTKSSDKEECSSRGTAPKLDKD